MVIIAGTLVPREYISTALGMHKSIEMAGTTIAQTLTGLLLDIKPVDKKLPPVSPPGTITKPLILRLVEAIVTAGSKWAVVRALRTFLFIAFLQTLSVAFLWWLARKSNKGSMQRQEAEYHAIQPSEDLASEESPMTEDAVSFAPPQTSGSSRTRLRGRIGLVASLSVIALAWIVFWGSAFVERS